jgi:hypothetical protein
MARRDVNVVKALAAPDPAVIIFTNRMKKARKLANLLIRFRVGYHAAARMTDEKWNELAQAGGWEEVGPFTRRIVLGMLAVRWKVRSAGDWIAL